MRVLAIIVAAGVLLYAADRLLLAAEARGWLFYRKRKASPGTRASAALELQAMLEPDRAHTIEAARQERSEDDESGDPPSTGGGGVAAGV